MAHGFLTPTPVSGDNFWKNVEWLWKKLNKEKEEKEKKEESGGALATTPKPDIYDPGLKAVRVSDVTASKAQKSEPPALKMLKQSAVAGVLGAGSDAIVKKEQLALPPGGPRLPGGASPTKGGTFTNLSGISAAPKKLDSEAFFKAAQTGVDPETGRYLSSEERKEFLKKSKSQLNATASVASAAAPGISSASSLMTKGDEAVVGSVDNLTNVVSSLVDAVKAQTAADKQIAQNAKSSAEKIANRSLARDEEKALEAGTDNSGFITPTGGLGSLTGGGSSGGGGGGLGLGTALGAAGKIIGKAAPGIGARGAARVLPRAGAAVAGKGGAKALMKIGGKTAARMIPGAQTAIGLGLAGEALSRGDILGAALSAGSAIPGPIGWGFLAADVARDVSGGGKGMARGGLVTGGKKSVVDDVPIRADEGEVVMSNAAGNAWGRGTLLAMNAMGGGSNNPTGGKAYNQGGLVGGDKAKSKQMFKLFGEGMIDAQKANSRDFARIQSQGLRQYYENEGGGERLGKNLASVWGKIGGVLGSLFSGTLTTLLGGAAQAAPTGNPADYLNGAGDFSGTSGQAQAMNYFMSQGLTKDQAAGIVGNLMQESGAGIDPKAKNATGHRGIAQWDKNRWGNFEKWAKQKDLDVNTREAQLQWIMEEMRTGAGGLSLKTLKGAKTSRESATMFLEKFERSGEKAGSAGFENRMKNAAKLAATKDFGSTMRGSGGAAALAQAAASMKGMSSKAAPDGGRNGCVWAVNKVFAKAGIPTPWGTSEYVPTAEEMMIKAGYTQVSSPQPGDLYVAPGQKHIGVITPDGKVISNSSSGAQFSWVDTVAGYNSYYRGKGKIYRMPAGVAAKAGKPSGTPTPTAAAAKKPTGSGGGRGSGSSPGSLRAMPTTAPANRTTGNEVAQASASYSSSMRNTRGGGTTIINNNNTQAGSGAQVAAAGPAGGSSSTGLAALALRVQS